MAATGFNNDSISLRIRYNHVSLILCGDAEAPAEEAMINLAGLMDWSLDANVAKISHHGHKDASSVDWLDATSPRAGLIPITTYESHQSQLPHGRNSWPFAKSRRRYLCGRQGGTVGRDSTGNSGHHVSVRTDGFSYEVSILESSSEHFPGNP